MFFGQKYRLKSNKIRILDVEKISKSYYIHPQPKIFRQDDILKLADGKG